MAEIARPICRRLERATEEELEWLLPMIAAFGPHAADAVPFLTEFLARREWLVQTAAAIGEIGSAAISAAPALEARLRAGWHGEVAAALVLIGSVESAPVICEVIQTVDIDMPGEWVQVPFDDRGREAWAATPVLLQLGESSVFRYCRAWFAIHSSDFCLEGSGVPDVLCRWIAEAEGEWEQRSLPESLERALEVERNPRPEWIETLDKAMQASAASSQRSRCPARRNRSSPEVEVDVSCDRIPRSIGRPEHFSSDDGIRRLVDDLIGVLQSGDFIERRIAFRVLGTLSASAGAAVPAILEFAGSTGCDSLRGMAIKVLGRIGPSAAPAVWVLLEVADAASRRSRIDAIDAMGSIGAVEAVDGLLDLLFRKQRSTYIQACLAHAISQCCHRNPDDAFPFVRRYLSQNVSGRLFEYLVEFVWHCRRRPGFFQDVAFELAGEYPHLRLSVSQYLGRCCVNAEQEEDIREDFLRFADLLASVAVEFPDVDLADVARGLGWLRDPRAIPLLVKELASRNPDEDDGYELLRALAQPEFADREEVMTVFRDAFESSDTELVSAAARTFHRLGPPAISLAGTVKQMADVNEVIRRHFDWDLILAYVDPDEALQRNPANQKALSNRADAAFERGDYPSARLDYSRLIDLDPEDDRAFFWRGYTHHRMGWKENALIDYEWAVELCAIWEDEEYD